MAQSKTVRHGPQEHMVPIVTIPIARMSENDRAAQDRVLTVLAALLSALPGKVAHRAAYCVVGSS